MLIGEFPPRPPTWRGTVGIILVKVVNRLLFWYTPQINRVQRLTAQAVSEEASAIQTLATTAAHLQRSIEEALQHINAVQSKVDSVEARLDAVSDQTSTVPSLATRAAYLQRSFEEALQHINAVQSRVDSVEARLDAVSDQTSTVPSLATRAAHLQRSFEEALQHINAVQSRVDSVETRLDSVQEVSSRIEGLETGLKAKGLLGLESLPAQLDKNRIDAVGAERSIHQLKAEAVIQNRRLASLFEEVRRTRDRDAEPPSLIMERAPNSALDSMYRSFEDVFRGTRSDIKGRLEIYLPALAENRIGSHGMPILDLGCGRGEWLELLQEHDLDAMGVDANEGMLEECRSRQFVVHHADALRFLKSLPTESQGAVTGFHIIEHLPFPILLEILDETVRVLKPGGLAIFETPNPENLLVGSHTFYLDPTHIRPLPASLMRFLVEARGLCQVDILPLHPCPPHYLLDETQNAGAKLLNQYFYGPQDYAVIGRKA